MIKYSVKEIVFHSDKSCYQTSYQLIGDNNRRKNIKPKTIISIIGKVNKTKNHR